MSAQQSASRRRQQQLARWAKQAPGYDLLLTQVLPRVRRNEVLSDLAWRVFAPQHGAGHVDVPLHGGRHLTGSDVRVLPVVAVVALGADEPVIVGLLDRLAEHQRTHRSFRPVLVTDAPAFVAARAHGYVLEHVVPRVAWGEEQGSWEDYLARRLSSIVDHYQTWALLHADGAALRDGDVRLLGALADRLPELDVDVVDHHDPGSRPA